MLKDVDKTDEKKQNVYVELIDKLMINSNESKSNL